MQNCKNSDFLLDFPCFANVLRFLVIVSFLHISLGNISRSLFVSEKQIAFRKSAVSVCLYPCAWSLHPRATPMFDQGSFLRRKKRFRLDNEEKIRIRDQLDKRSDKASGMSCKPRKKCKKYNKKLQQ